MWTYGEKIVGTFYEKELQKANQKEFRIQKATKRNGVKLYVKWLWQKRYCCIRWVIFQSHIPTVKIK